MAGASARSAQLDSIADNLANAQTPGFKGAQASFSTVLAETHGANAYVMASGNGADLRPGPVVSTGNALDVLPEHGAFLAVQAATGETAFTRDGRLSLDANETLRSAGLAVLSQSGQQINLPRDAQLQITTAGQVLADGHEIDRIAMYQLDGPAQRLGPSVVAPDVGGTAAPIDGKLQIGSIEAGNHSALDSAVDLISAQRSFDASMQAVQTYKHLGDSSNELGRVR